MTNMRIILLALLLYLHAGCTNLLFQGDFTAQDSTGKERHFVLYWTRTEPLIGQSKAGPAILLTECSPYTRIDFADQPEGIVFRGMPGFDRLAGQTGASELNLICGKILSYSSLVEAREGPLALSIFCQPVSDEFSLQKRTYLAARPEPYALSISEKLNQWSFFGATLPGPPVPDCRDAR